MRSRLRSGPDAVDAVRLIGVHLFERRPGEVAVGGGEDVRDAGAGKFVPNLWPPCGLFIPVLHLANTAIPLEDFDVLVRDGLEVHIERGPGEKSELLQIDRDQGGPRSGSRW